MFNIKKEVVTEVMNANKQQRIDRKPEISNHVVTRWYRAPEVITLDKNYDQAIDIWGAGCILGELLFKAKLKSETQTVLFKGASCYPLSPVIDAEDSQ